MIVPTPSLSFSQAPQFVDISPGAGAATGARARGRTYAYEQYDPNARDPRCVYIGKLKGHAKVAYTSGASGSLGRECAV